MRQAEERNSLSKQDERQRMRVNYHTHTFRCGHAFGTEREYIEKAIEGGIGILGFSDHTPQPFRNGSLSSIRMEMRELDSYVYTLESLRKEYQGQIQIKIGLEAEFFPALFEELMDRIGQYPIEYLIMGQHYLGECDESIYAGMTTRDERFLELYVSQVLEGLRTGRFSYLAHPDVMDFIGRKEIYDKHMTRLCRGCRELGIPLEVNRLGVYEGRNYPSARFFTIAAREGNEVVIGYDAHNPETLSDEAAYQNCKRFAAAFGIEPNEEFRI